MPRIVRFAKHGGPEVLEVREEPLEEPGEGEVRLKIEAIGLNRAEIMFRHRRLCGQSHLSRRASGSRRAA